VPQQISALFLIGMDWQLAAGVKDSSIGGLWQAWTLGAELVFYLSAPLLMRSWKIGATLLVLSLGYRLGYVALNGPALHPQWTYAFPPATFCFFMLGHLVCIASNRWRALASPTLGWSALAVSAAAMVWGGNFADFDGSRFWLSVACFTVALPGVFAATMRIGWMNALGDLSYPVYLVHLLPLSVAAPMVVEAAAILSPSPYLSTGAFAVVVLASAIVAHRLIETPTAYAMRWALLLVSRNRRAIPAQR
jgi:peptidoglycan/LPS O-acetylase OafA/YrhL